LRRFGGMKDLPLAAGMYIKKMCIKISLKSRGIYATSES